MKKKVFLKVRPNLCIHLLHLKKKILIFLAVNPCKYMHLNTNNPQTLNNDLPLKIHYSL